MCELAVLFLHYAHPPQEEPAHRGFVREIGVIHPFLQDHLVLLLFQRDHCVFGLNIVLLHKFFYTNIMRVEVIDLLLRCRSN